MPTSPRPGGARRISFDTAQRVVLVSGIVILLGLAALLYFTRVDPIEVWAVLFYLPVFLGFMLWGLVGGAAAGVAAAAAYVAIRYPSLNAIQGRDVLSLLLARALGYVAFGAIGGWASAELGGSIRKLNRVDTVDDDTGLLNARQFVVELERQIERAQRYGTTFSVAVSEFDLASATSASRRMVRGQLARLGEVVSRTVRQVDAAAHSSDGTLQRFGVLLPDTAEDGAAVFADRLSRGLQAAAIPLAEIPTVSATSFAQDPDFVQRVLSAFRDDDLRQNGPREEPAR